jgi:hypothetical protein
MPQSGSPRAWPCEGQRYGKRLRAMPEKAAAWPAAHPTCRLGGTIRAWTPGRSPPGPESPWGGLTCTCGRQGGALAGVGGGTRRRATSTCQPGLQPTRIDAESRLKVSPARPLPRPWGASGAGAPHAAYAPPSRDPEVPTSTTQSTGCLGPALDCMRATQQDQTFEISPTAQMAKGCQPVCSVNASLKHPPIIG